MIEERTALDTIVDQCRVRTETQLSLAMAQLRSELSKEQTNLIEELSSSANHNGHQGEGSRNLYQPTRGDQATTKPSLVYGCER